MSIAPRRSTRKAIIAGLLLSLSILAVAATPPGPAVGEAAGTGFADDSTTVVDKTFVHTGSEQWHSLPPGVTGVDLVAVGGWGATKSGRAGGRPHKVAARINFEPLTTMYLMVAGNGKGDDTGEGGFNGGGQGATAHWATSAGGGGGGATDVRLVEDGWEGTLESRLLVAAGGGGAGSTSNFGDRGGGPGGDAAAVGSRGDNGTPQNGAGSGGFGGAPGTDSAGGEGGIGGFVYNTSYTGDNGKDGADGELGAGGSGGLGVENTGTGLGGGGGGGYFGGGGGGGGIHMHFPPDVYVSGGGGGGGGSSLVPAGGTVTLAEVGEQPRATVHYTVPGTRILSGPPARTESSTVSFAIESTEAGSSLECSLNREHAFEPCDATIEFANLPAGVHTFRARSINAMGNVDLTPATWVFEVGSEPQDDEGESGADDGTPGAGQPPVVVPKPGGKSERARFKLGKPKLNRRRGSAVVPVRVSEAGRLQLVGNRRVRPVTARAWRGATLRMKVAPRGGFAVRLQRRGRLTVRLNFRFVTAEGDRITRSRTLTLRRARVAG